MAETTTDAKERPSGTVLSVSTADEDERLRALIRAELDRHHALPVARRTLELMAEAAAEPASGQPGYRIVDRNGETRLRPVAAESADKAKDRKKPRRGEAPPAEPEAASVPMTLSELVGELRGRHPDLFGTPPPEPEPPPPPPPQQAAVGERMALLKAAGARFVRTQSALARSLAARSAERGRTIAAAAGESVDGWRQQLDEQLKAHRAPMPESAEIAKPSDSQAPPTTTAATAAPPAALTGSASATQPRRDWRAFGWDAVTRLRASREAVRTRSRKKSDDGAPGPAAPASVPSLREVAGDLIRRRLIVAGIGVTAAAAIAAAVVVLVRHQADTAPVQDGAAQESPAQTGPTQQAEAPPPAAREPAPTPPSAPPPADPEEQPDEPQSRNPGEIAGVPEVIDTATLRVSGKLVRLFGVEWVRGGQSEELAKYLAGRSVRCLPATGSSAYLCSVNGRDLSEVVLFNGGGRASPEATPDLIAAEDRARTERLGVWKR